LDVACEDTLASPFTEFISRALEGAGASSGVRQLVKLSRVKGTANRGGIITLRRQVLE